MPSASVQFFGIDKPFVDRFRNRRVNATPRSSREWAGQLARDRNPFFFSARCSDAKLLSAMKRYLERDMSGERAHGKARFISDMRRLLGVPLSGEADSGKLTDLKSSRRLSLIYEFQRERVRAEQAQASEDNDDHRVMFPWREFYRPSSSHPKAPRNWKAHAASLGFTIKQGRIFAPRDSILWRKLNRFGFDHAPWDYNSGMDTRWVSRAECARLGLKITSWEKSLKDSRAVEDSVAQEERERRDYFSGAVEAPGSIDAVRAASLSIAAFRKAEDFASVEARNIWATRRFEAAHKNAPTFDRRTNAAFKRYTDDSSEINAAFRENLPNKDTDRIREAFENASFGVAMEVERTASLKELRAVAGYDVQDFQSLVGKSLIYNNPVSASVFGDYRPRGLKIRDKVQVRYRIRLNQGDRVLPLDGLSTKGPYGLSGTSGIKKAPPRIWSEDGRNSEGELLIAPDSKFRVDNVSEESHNVGTIVTLTLRLL